MVTGRAPLVKRPLLWVASRNTIGYPVGGDCLKARGVLVHADRGIQRPADELRLQEQRILQHRGFRNVTERMP